jgi:hypothetical protein
LRHTQAIRDIADTQHGLITSAQLGELGVWAKTTSRRNLGYMWTKILDGVHLVDGGTPSQTQLERGALLYAGEGAQISGTVALRHHGVRALRLQERVPDHDYSPEPVLVLISHQRRRKSAGYTRIERTRRLPQNPVIVNGLTIAPLPRAVADAARRMRTAHDVNALVAEVVQRGMCTVEELQTELDEGSRRGSALLRDAVTHVRTGARSGPEVDLVSLFRVAGVPHVVYNSRLVDASGQLIAIPDAWLDDVGLAVEVDSREHHGAGDGFARTVRRNRRYARAGVTVFAILPEEFSSHPNGVLHDLIAAREAAAARPRPNVRAIAEEHRSAGRSTWRWGT